MCSGNEDCPAVTWTSNGLYKIKKLSSKISSWIEQIDLIHTQINSDINNRETALSNNTKALIINLISQFDAEPALYTFGTVGLDSTNVTTEATHAHEFGLALDLYSQSANILVRSCNADYWDINHEEEFPVYLGLYDAIVLNSNSGGYYNPDEARLEYYIQFLNNIANHLRYIKLYLDCTSHIKKSESPC